MEILVLCGIYIVEMLCYQMGLVVLFDTKVKKSKWLALGLIVPVLLGNTSIYITAKNILITLLVIILNCILTKKRIAEKIFENVMVLVLTSCLEDVLVRVGTEILHLNEIIIVDKNEKYLLLRSCTFVIIIISYFCLKGKKRKEKAHVSAFAYFVIGLVAVSMMFCLAVLNYVKNYYTDSKFVIIYSILDVVVHVNIVLLVIFIMNIKSANMKIEELLKSEQMLKNMQMQYYKNLLEKEKETRKYRHDMNNHLFYIQSLLERNHEEEAKVYVEQLQGRFQGIQTKNYVTGNEQVDVIMNYFFGLLPETTEVLVMGRCPVKLALEDTDICTIFSNVFQNVVEAILENRNKKGYVEIHINKGSSYVEYIIENTFERDRFKAVDMENQIPGTHKSDEKNHGIGLSNVKQAVEDNHGRFEWKVNDQRFLVKIVLPIDRLGS
ncbi:MAG: GHKL domain-containing protein [Lachnospiraceae bacterium]|nr:GHKL domain-containing protein [Lachnospiraceae bacterium]